MKERNYTGLVPKNTDGKEITAESSVKFRSAHEAKQFYQTARQRLLNVNDWGNLAGSLSASFQLTDASGHNIDRQVKEGDHFRIDITGPGSNAGEGYDWAMVEATREINEEDVDSIAIRVRPARNPATPNAAVAHFFSEHSSSTFVLTRELNMVTASVYDRNIEANEETTEPVDKIRNSIVGLAAKHGFSHLQWKALVNGFVETEDEKHTK